MPQQNDFSKEASKLLEKILEEFSHELAEGIKALSVTTLEDMAEYVKERSEFYASNDFKMLKEALPYAWNYDEAYRQKYTLEEAIKWFKVHAPKDASSEGCLLMEKEKYGPYMLHHCFIRKSDNQPLLNGRFPHRLVKAREIDKDLESTFGNKQMIVIR